MIKILKTTITLFYVFSITLFANDINKTLNLDFETISNGVPENWYLQGENGYEFKIDSNIVQSGKHSISCEFVGNEPDYTWMTISIPEEYYGKKITLSGYIKTDNVNSGYAGFFIRIDPKIAFNDMSKNPIVGTTDWKKYEITLEMDQEQVENAEDVTIGAIFVGKGKMWIDNMSIKVEDKDISEYKRVFNSKALVDHEFDKGSNIKLENLTGKQVDNLELLGFIWGYLKYYHPNVAAGNYNWDYELFRFMPKYLKVKNDSERDNLLLDWAKSLGEFKVGAGAKFDSSAVKQFPDFTWINETKMSSALVNYLNLIRNAERSDKNYYMGLVNNVGNIKVKHELNYPDMKYDDDGVKLLALYRYWNIVHYFFPYKYLNKDDWKLVLKEYIPKIINAKNRADYSLILLEIANLINDTHSGISTNDITLNSIWGLNIVPVDLKYIDKSVVVSQLYTQQNDKSLGLELGDIITKINNEDITNLINKKMKYHPASNEPVKYSIILQDILRTNDTLLNLEIIRNTKAITLSVPLIPISDYYKLLYREYHQPMFKMLDSNIAYIFNGTLLKDSIESIWGKIKNTKGLVIDNRNYPFDFPLFMLCNKLLPDEIHFANTANSMINEPGYFVFKNPIFAGSKHDDYYKGKIVIIVNEETLSNSEFHAMAYRRHPNATVIGSKTAGADGDVSAFNLPGYVSAYFTGYCLYNYDGKETQGIGIVPDVICKPTINGIKNNRDELLEKAIEIINTK